MPTGKSYSNFTSKRILGKTDFSERIFDYLQYTIQDLVRSFYDNDYVIGNQIIIEASAGTDKVRIFDSGTNVRCSDGLGRTFDPFFGYDIYGVNLFDFTANVPFENATGSDYHVALHHAKLPATMDTNPRTGYPEWTSYLDIIGVEGNPDSVTDNGDGTITFEVSTVVNLEDYTDRVVGVYMPDLPQGAGLTAFEWCTVWMDGAVAKITTVGALGQTTITTEVTDYQIVIPGLAISKNIDFSAVEGYVYIGYIVGNGPAATPDTFVMDDQRIVPASFPTIFFDGLPSDFYPRTDGDYDLGRVDKRWRNLYLTNLNISTNLVPGSHNAYDIGLTGTRWRDLYLGRNLYIAGEVNSSLIPGEDVTFDLGSNSKRWKDLYATGEGVVNVDVLSSKSTLSGNMPVRQSDGEDFRWNALASKAFFKTTNSGDGSWVNIWSASNSKLVNSEYDRFIGIELVKSLNPADSKIGKYVVVVFGANGVPLWSDEFITPPGPPPVNSQFVGVGGSPYHLALIDPDTLEVHMKYFDVVDLPNGSGETWVPRSFCSDGDFVYVHFEDWHGMVPANVTHRVQAFELTSNGLKAIRKDGWPSTGIVPTSSVSTINGVYNSNFEACLRRAEMIVASMVDGEADCIAMANDWVPSTTASAPMVSIISAVDGTIITEGHGDYVPDANDYRAKSLASNGTHILCDFKRNEAVGEVLVSLDITDATIDPGFAGTPKIINTISNSLFHSLVRCLGDYFVVFGRSVWNTGASDEIALIVKLDPSVDYMDKIYQQGVGVERLYGGVCDGRNFWFAVGGAKDLDPEQGYLELHKTNGGFSDVGDQHPSFPTYSDLIESKDSITLSGEIGAFMWLSFVYKIGLVCDGNYLFMCVEEDSTHWMMVKVAPGDPYDSPIPGIVRRLPLTAK